MNVESSFDHICSIEFYIYIFFFWIHVAGEIQDLACFFFFSSFLSFFFVQFFFTCSKLKIFCQLNSNSNNVNAVWSDCELLAHLAFAKYTLVVE